MERALKESGLAPERIGYINASGMSTTMDDIAETRAIKAVFGDIANQIPVSSIKPITGYAISASETLEAAICALSIHRGVIPPTINLHSPEEECDLDYVPHDPREIMIDVAMSNSFGIDGNYSSIVLEKFKE
jgi:3-oxoacyl-[acyl-carrier-protein] synthase II